VSVGRNKGGGYTQHADCGPAMLAVHQFEGKEPHIFLILENIFGQLLQRNGSVRWGS